MDLEQLNDLTITPWFLYNVTNATAVSHAHARGLLMPQWGYVVAAFVLFLIGFFGFFLNLMVILLMIKDRQLWTPLNIILFNLVCSDFSVSILGNPFTLISSLYGHWIFGDTMCTAYGFFMALLGISSITSLTVISFERYLMVTRPLSSRNLNPRGAAFSLIFIWSYSLALTTPPLLGWGNYVNEAANISCSVNWHEQSNNTLTYILFLFAFGQILPSLVITFSYVNIIRTMRRNSQRLGRVNRAEARATTMVFIMIMAFTVAWTPYSVFALIEQFGKQGIISPGMGVIPALVAKSSICYDPLIYVGMNTQFRQSIRRMFGIHRRERNSFAERRPNNTVTSPAFRLTSANETERSHTYECKMPNTLRKRDKILTINEEMSDLSNTELNTPYNLRRDLPTIQENKIDSNERSGETVVDESSSNSGKHNESSRLLTEPSPLLVIIDSERTVFSKKCPKHRKRVRYADRTRNTYGNQGYVDDPSDVKERPKRRSKMKRSRSLDLGQMHNFDRKRKLSIETTFIQPKQQFKGIMLSKLLEQQNASQNHDEFKSHIHRPDRFNEGDYL